MPDGYGPDGQPVGGRRPGKHAAGARRQPDPVVDPDAPAPGPDDGTGDNATGDNADGVGDDNAAKEAAARSAAAAAKSKAAKQKKFWREVVAIIVAAAVLTLLVKAFVVQVYRIPSASMENTLLPGDRVLVNKVVYHFRSIARGDIIVFSGQGSWGPDAPPLSSDPVVRVFDDVLSAVGLHSGDTFYIKRVIGLPGDRVACCTAGKVTVNGVALSEIDYLFPGSEPSTQPFNITVPAGRLWVMGDNREDSDDSRGHMVGYPGNGTIPENEVVGRAFVIIWPLSRVNDLPIPNTFQQASLHSGAMGAALVGAADAGGAALTAIASAPPATAAGGAAAAAGVVAVPLLWRRRSSR